MKHFKKPKSSWNKVSIWYSKITQGEGHYYHRSLIIPKLLKILKLNNNSKVLDLGCGSGILGRSINKEIQYTGIDISKNLIDIAKKEDKSRVHKYLNLDASNFKLNEKFTDAVFILSFQNMEQGEEVIKNTAMHLDQGGRIHLVLNHPIFRIPRQTSWEVDPRTKLEYRRINMYMSKIKIPINMNPGDKNSEFTWSYHTPLFEISRYLTQNGFLIERIEEWVSDKTSVGKNAKQENRARNEFPLFMAITAKRQ